MNFIKQSTSIDIPIGPFVDKTDGDTEETGLTLTQPDIRLKKNGGAWAQKNASQTLSHEEAGWYELTLDATDTDTLGLLMVSVHESGALPVWREFQVVTANFYDSICGSDTLQADVTQFNGTNGTFSSGRPEVNTSHIAGSAVSTSSAQIGVNVVNFGGSAGTFASGRPEINVSHISGSAVSITSAQIGTNVVNAAGTAWNSGAISASTLAGDTITAAKLASDVGTEIATAVWAYVVEGSYTAVQFMRGFAAALMGKATGLDTGNPVYRDTGDSKDRIDATTDTDGNRSAVTLDLT